MFCKVSLLTVALALLASASPIVEERGIRIDLPKRSSLTKADDTFDHDEAIIQTYKAANKHRQNLINLEANRGKKAFNEGAEIKPLAILPEHLAKRQSEPLTDQEDDTEWTGGISIGSNNQKFIIDFDTGSLDLWVPDASGCLLSLCSGKHTYNPPTSSTRESLPGTFSIQYADRSTVSGPIVKDTVTVAGAKATSQTFSAFTTLSNLFQNNPTDGILGMAFPAISSLKALPFFQNAFNKGAFLENAFAFKLASSGSSIFLGGTNTSLYSGSVEYHSVADTSF